MGDEEARIKAEKEEQAAAVAEAVRINAEEDAATAAAAEALIKAEEEERVAAAAEAARIQAVQNGELAQSGVHKGVTMDDEDRNNDAPGASSLTGVAAPSDTDVHRGGELAAKLKAALERSSASAPPKAPDQIFFNLM